MKLLGIIGSLFALSVAGLLWWGSTSQTVTGAPATGTIAGLSVEENNYDFGTIRMKDGNVEHNFTVTNTTNQPVEVRKVYTSCMCTTAFLQSTDREKGPFGMEGMGFFAPANEVIEPGESRAVRVVYDPNAHGPAGVGAIDRFIYLTDPSGGELRFEIRAMVTP